MTKDEYIKSRKLYNDTIKYLKKNFLKNDFCDKHTRKELSEILNILFKHFDNRNHYGMCKKRAIKHIEFYLLLHDIKCEEMSFSKGGYCEQI